MKISFFCLNLKRAFVISLSIFGLALTLSLIIIFGKMDGGFVNSESSYIKWVEFNVPYDVLKRVMEIDIKSRNEEVKIDYIQLLSYISAKNGGNYKNHKNETLNNLVADLKGGKKMDELTDGVKLYPYYLEAYNAVLAEYLGEYEIEITDKDGMKQVVTKYGLKVKHPIMGSYSESDDFGNSRNYGFKRKHLGHDLMAAVGTAVCAFEGGIVEALGWNQYGGWRVGIRSFDGLRYYYYAHLRKDNPFAKDLAEGQTVRAGQVIGYVGMTGYSVKENVNNIQTPHLHFGIQLIFDESQKEGVNQIWIDCYQISKLVRNPPAGVVLQ